MFNLRPIAIWLLLLPLALTVVPRDMLHQCVHEAVVHAHEDMSGQGSDCTAHEADRRPDQQQARIEVDCPICDAHVLVAIPGVVLTELVVDAVRTPVVVVPGIALHEVVHRVPGDRGPPAKG